MAAELRGHARASPPELSQVLDGLATCVLWLDGEGTVLHLNEPAELAWSQANPPAPARRAR